MAKEGSIEKSKTPISEEIVDVAPFPQIMTLIGS
jgi:hypothetical protein